MKTGTIGAIILVAIAATANSKIHDKGWWKTSVVYEIQPRSFFDSNADGIGDLKGITHQLTHLVDSGVQAIWLSSINPSAKYFGNDVIDYKDIDKSLGNMSDFKALVKEAKRRGLRVLLDFVPNHTSDQHYWFERSIASQGKYKDYYIWAVGRNNNKNPPNNWLTVNGAPAWTYHDTRKMWYYHQFEADQPDLNYRNQFVKREMEEVLHYWLVEGIDGFCVRDAAYIFESTGLSDEKFRSQTKHNVHSCPMNNYSCLNHTYTQDQRETFDLIGEWRRILDDYANRANVSEKVLMSEVSGNSTNVAKFYHAGSQVPLDVKFIGGANSGPSAGHFKHVIDDWTKALPKDATANWLLGGQKYSRLTTRYPKRADQIVMVAMVLPGLAVTYYGDEIGMEDNSRITFPETQDLIARRAGPKMYKQFSRDPHRTPYQWNDTTNAGFSRANRTWLPVNKQYRTLNLARQKMTLESSYKVYRKLTSLRRTSAALQHGTLQTTVLQNDVLMIVRGASHERITLFVNFSNSTEHRIRLNGTGKNSILLTSLGANARARYLVNHTMVVLPPIASVLVSTNGTGKGSNSKSTAATTLIHPLSYVLVLITVLLMKY